MRRHLAGPSSGSLSRLRSSGKRSRLLENTKNNRPMRVVIVEDHDLVRRCLSMVLSRREDVEVVGEAITAAEALEMVSQLRPDVVMTDLVLPDLSGVELSREIRTQSPDTRVLILTSRADDRAVIGSVIGGASGYLLKEIQSQQIIEAVRKVGQGASLLEPTITRRVLERVRSGAEEYQESALTKDEQDILELVAQGWNNLEIAVAVSQSVATVKVQVNTIYGKLEITRRSQAASFSGQWRSRRTPN